MLHKYPSVASRLGSLFVCFFKHVGGGAGGGLTESERLFSVPLAKQI